MTRKPLIRMAALLAIAAAVITPIIGTYGRSLAGPDDAADTQALVALGNDFTFQGKLADGGNPANGEYDFVFTLYDALGGGLQVGSAETKGNVPVAGGLFTVSLNYGDVFHGSKYFLEIQVRPGASGGAYTTLTPRQPIASVPSAQFASKSGSTTSLQGVAVSTDAPAAGNVLQFDGSEWVAAPPTGGGGFSLPFTASQSSLNPLFTITNAGTGANSSAIVAKSNSTAAGVEALVGHITSTSAGGFSAAVRGMNSGTGSAGIGVYGSQDGGGWGVYGTAPDGRGVYGTSTSGVGVQGSSSSSTGGLFSSGTGMALSISGPIHVQGSKPAAFVHTASAPSNHVTVIDHPSTNDNPNAIVMVTQRWEGVYNPNPVGVFYAGGRWRIFNENVLADMPVGAQFNIFVINR
jgi:hypothetical protein